MNDIIINTLENGDMEITFTGEALKDLNSWRFDSVELIVWAIQDSDCDLLDSSYDCFGFYNYFTDKVYNFRFPEDEETLKRGETLTLQANIPDSFDRDLIDKYCEAVLSDLRGF